MTNTHKTVSIVAACRNEIKHIAGFLESVLAQHTDGFDLEVLIADGMSDDGTRDVLARFRARDSRLRVFDNPSLTTAPGLNGVIREARGEIILRMDAHTEYAPEYVLECIRVLEETGADNVGGAARTKSEGLMARAIAAAYHNPFASGGARFHNESYEGWVDTVPYGCWRRETLLRLGLFDEQLVRNQDDELNFRITRSGGKIWQSARIRSWYRPRGSLRQIFRQYLQYGYWKVAVIRKHGRVASWRHVMPPLFVVVNLLLPVIALAAMAAGMSAIASWVGKGEVLLIVAYSASSIGAAGVSIRKHGFAAAALLPVVFPVFHVSYGIGFLWGLCDTLTPSVGRQPRAAITQLTR